MANKILIGADQTAPLYTFTDATIRTVSCVLSSALSGDELAIDQLLPTVYSEAYIHVRFVPAGSTGLITADGYTFMCYPGTGFLDKLPYGTPIWYYSDDVLIGKFYSKRVVRSGKTWFDITAVSFVGILDGQQHNGGIYTGQTFQTVAADIMGSSAIFSCSDEVAAIKVYGWLPIDTRRANLHQLLFACGVMLDKDISGDIYFRFPDANTVKDVPDNRIFLGGNVDYMTPATRADVTEHTFIASQADQTVTLFDNTDASGEADHSFVSFQEPCHDLASTGSIVIHESGVNYAIISGTGTLTGKQYTHITKTITAESSGSGEEKAVTVTEATLVSVANSENVAKRILSYYSAARTIQSDMIVHDEKPGDQIRFSNPFGDPETAFLASMDVNASSFLRASCELVTGYVPSGNGNNYNKSVVLTGSGEWESPVTGDILVTIIGAGSGASGGHAGGAADSYDFNWGLQSDSIGSDYIGYLLHYLSSGSGECLLRRTMPDTYNYTIPGGKTPGVGGAPGTPGKGGKVLTIKMHVTKGQKISYSCGVGGEGGIGEKITSLRDDGLMVNDVEWTEAAPGWNDESWDPKWTVSEATDGEDGTDTTFGPYSSANGFRQDYGYLDILTGILYASTGDDGNTGGDGNLGGAVSNTPDRTVYPSNITDAIFDAITVKDGNGVSPGRCGKGTWEQFDELDIVKRFASGGGGTSGTAYNAVGLPGGSVDSENEYIEYPLKTPGIGVKGANADMPTDCTVIGKGGTAGHGGGGGSCAGDLWTEFRGGWSGYNISRFGGLGGDASKGGKGGPGGIVIYLKEE